MRRTVSELFLALARPLTFFFFFVHFDLSVARTPRAASCRPPHFFLFISLCFFVDRIHHPQPSPCASEAASAAAAALGRRQGERLSIFRAPASAEVSLPAAAAALSTFSWSPRAAAATAAKRRGRSWSVARSWTGSFREIEKGKGGVLMHFALFSWSWLLDLACPPSSRAPSLALTPGPSFSSNPRNMACT